MIEEQPVEEPLIQSLESTSYIEIELFRDTPFYAGERLEGNIHIYAKDVLKDTNKITLAFDGEESVTHYPKKKPVTDINVVVSHIFTVYDSKVVAQGMYTFPFTLFLPESLPQSHLSLSSNEKTDNPKKPLEAYTQAHETRISYTLTARVEGTKSFLVNNL